MGTEVAGRADFSGIRYAQCWEDADILLEALDIQPGDRCLAIASAGDNVLAMLSRQPERVIAVDLSPAQLACLELRVAAYRTLSHAELLELIGSMPSQHRADHYRRCRPLLMPAARDFWDAHSNAVEQGVGGAGKFERYFALFRTRVLPLVHRNGKVQRLLEGGSSTEREAFYCKQWDTWRWRLLFRIFFSRFVMGRLGRDPSFFRYAEDSCAEQILKRTRHALTTLNPAENPYLQWILTGRHTTALPFALRPENFNSIRENLDRLEWRCQSIEDALDGEDSKRFDRYNLSDIFEYMSADNYEKLLTKLVERGNRGGRLAYWNMLVPRNRPESLCGRLQPRPELAGALHAADKAFFYSGFIVEEIL
jgi:S-adenosylmethionine-diacylglycerol 3-amino-3-carboxypropyl transferase